MKNTEIQTQSSVIEIDKMRAFMSALPVYTEPVMTVLMT
jgi:hypothetical protein